MVKQLQTILNQHSFQYIRQHRRSKHRISPTTSMPFEITRLLIRWFYDGRAEYTRLYVKPRGRFYVNQMNRFRKAIAICCLLIMACLPSLDANAQNVPEAPTNLQAMGGDLFVALIWNIQGDGGSTITIYQYRKKPESETFGQWTDTSITGRSGENGYVVTSDLNYDVNYTFEVRAVNVVGAGPESNPAEVALVDEIPRAQDVHVLASGQNLEIDFSEPLAGDSASTPGADRFVVEVDGSSVEKGEVSFRTNTTLVIVLDEIVYAGSDIMIEYNGNALQDLTSNKVQPFGMRVNNNSNQTRPEQPPNEPPKFGGSKSRTISEDATPGEAVGFPVVATDADGDRVTYTLSHTDAALFAIDEASGQITVGESAQLDFETKPELVVRVTAQDSRGKSANVLITINVTDANDRPVFPSETASREIAEHSTHGSLVGDPVTATDQDGDTLTYFLAGTGVALFRIDAKTGQITVGEDTELDFETRMTYALIVVANDGRGATTNIPVTVNVTDINDSPTFPDETVALEIAENSAAGSLIGDPVVAVDQDGDPLTYSLAGDDAALFRIGAETGQITVGEGTELDFETRMTYTLKVVADDGRGATADVSVTINVTEANERPVFLDKMPIREIAENSAAGSSIGDPVTAADQDGDTLTYSLTGGDAALFHIDAETGQITVGEDTELDFETRMTYTLKVVADDGRGATADVSVTINVTDVNDKPSFPDETVALEIAENSATGSPIGDPLAAVDQDGDPLTYSLAGDDAALFRIDAETGQITVGEGTELDFETRMTYTLKVVADDGRGATADVSVTINVTDVNDRPMFPNETAIREIAENSAAGSPIGDPVTAVDQDGDTLTYSLTGGDAALFRIDAETGQITVGEDTELDFETRMTYTLTVGADDGRGATADVSVTVDVTDVNDRPMFPNETAIREIAENSAAGSPAGDPVTAVDQDGDTLTYSLTGGDAALFRIDTETGQITVSANVDLNFEVQTTHALIVTAADPESETDQQSVTVKVIDVNEPPRAPIAPVLAAAGSSALHVTWAAPENTGPPILSYDVEYRIRDDEEWLALISPITQVTATIHRLDSNRTYETQVRAMNDEGIGPWSPTSFGTTDIAVLQASFDAHDYTVDEGGTTTITVTLSPAADRIVEIPIVSTETASVENMPSTLLFVRGDSSSSFTLMAMQDDNNAEDETLIITFGALPASVEAGSPASATVMFTDDDKAASIRMNRLNQEILGRHALGLMENINTTVARRLEAMSSHADAHTQSFRWNSQTSWLETLLAITGQPSTRTFHPLQLLPARALRFPLRTKARSWTDTTTIWAQGGYNSLDGNHDSLSWKGGLMNTQLGIDTLLRPNALAGLSASWSYGEFNYDDLADAGTGYYESTLTSIHPYVGWQSNGTALWGAFGQGRGDVAIADEGRAEQSSDLAMHGLSVGGRSKLVSNSNVHRRVSLHLQGDAMLARVDIEHNGLINAATADASRIRLMLTGSYHRLFDSGHSLTTSLELGARRDGGFVDDSLGAEIGVGVSHVYPAIGLTLETHGRVMVGDTPDKWGLNGLIQIDPGADNLGLALQVKPVSGIASSSVQRLWKEGLSSVGAWNINRGSQVSAELATVSGAAVAY